MPVFGSASGLFIYFWPLEHLVLFQSHARIPCMIFSVGVCLCTYILLYPCVPVHCAAAEGLKISCAVVLLVEMIEPLM